MAITIICIGILGVLTLYKAGEVLYMRRKLELRDKQIDGLRLTIEAYKELYKLDQMIPKGERTA
jgi:hypothetical protein